MLNPKTYKSPSGEYELHVDPSTKYGEGEGHYRMLRGGAEVCAKKLPFTLWDAGVADDGTAAGYAEAEGADTVHLVIIDPAGELRMHDALEQPFTRAYSTAPGRLVAGFVFDPENDRFIVRCDMGWHTREETWRIYRLSILGGHDSG